MRRPGEFIPMTRKPRLWLQNGLWWCGGMTKGGWFDRTSSKPYVVQGQTPASAYQTWKAVAQ